MDSGSFISLATSATALARIKGVELEQEQKHPLHVTNIQRWLWSYRSVPNKNSKNATCISKLPTPKILKKYLVKAQSLKKSSKSLINLWMSAVCLHICRNISCLFTFIIQVSAVCLQIENYLNFRAKNKLSSLRSQCCKRDFLSYFQTLCNSCIWDLLEEMKFSKVD